MIMFSIHTFYFIFLIFYFISFYIMETGSSLLSRAKNPIDIYDRVPSKGGEKYEKYDKSLTLNTDKDVSKEYHYSTRVYEEIAEKAPVNSFKVTNVHKTSIIPSNMKTIDELLGFETPVYGHRLPYPKTTKILDHEDDDYKQYPLTDNTYQQQMYEENREKYEGNSNGHQSSRKSATHALKPWHTPPMQNIVKNEYDYISNLDENRNQGVTSPIRTLIYRHSAKPNPPSTKNIKPYKSKSNSPAKSETGSPVEDFWKSLKTRSFILPEHKKQSSPESFHANKTIIVSTKNVYEPINLSLSSEDSNTFVKAPPVIDNIYRYEPIDSAWEGLSTDIYHFVPLSVSTYSVTTISTKKYESVRFSALYLDDTTWIKRYTVQLPYRNDILNNNNENILMKNDNSVRINEFIKKNVKINYLKNSKVPDFNHHNSTNILDNERAAPLDISTKRIVWIKPLEKNNHVNTFAERTIWLNNINNDKDNLSDILNDKRQDILNTRLNIYDHNMVVTHSARTIEMHEQDEAEITAIFDNPGVTSLPEPTKITELNEIETDNKDKARHYDRNVSNDTETIITVPFKKFNKEHWIYRMKNINRNDFNRKSYTKVTRDSNYNRLKFPPKRKHWKKSKRTSTFAENETTHENVFIDNSDQEITRLANLTPFSININKNISTTKSVKYVVKYLKSSLIPNRDMLNKSTTVFRSDLKGHAKEAWNKIPYKRIPVYYFIPEVSNTQAPKKSLEGIQIYKNSTVNKKPKTVRNYTNNVPRKEIYRYTALLKNNDKIKNTKQFMEKKIASLSIDQMVIDLDIRHKTSFAKSHSKLLNNQFLYELYENNNNFLFPKTTQPLEHLYAISDDFNERIVLENGNPIQDNFNTIMVVNNHSSNHGGAYGIGSTTGLDLYRMLTLIDMLRHKERLMMNMIDATNYNTSETYEKSSNIMEYLGISRNSNQKYYTNFFIPLQHSKYEVSTITDKITSFLKAGAVKDFNSVIVTSDIPRLMGPVESTRYPDDYWKEFMQVKPRKTSTRATVSWMKSRPLFDIWQEFFKSEATTNSASTNDFYLFSPLPTLPDIPLRTTRALDDYWKEFLSFESNRSQGITETNRFLKRGTIPGYSIRKYITTDASKTCDEESIQASSLHSTNEEYYQKPMLPSKEDMYANLNDKELVTSMPYEYDFQMESQNTPTLSFIYYANTIAGLSRQQADYIEHLKNSPKAKFNNFLFLASPANTHSVSETMEYQGFKTLWKPTKTGHIINPTSPYKPISPNLAKTPTTITSQLTDWNFNNEDAAWPKVEINLATTTDSTSSHKLTKSLAHYFPFHIRASDTDVITTITTTQQTTQVSNTSTRLTEASTTSIFNQSVDDEDYLNETREGSLRRRTLPRCYMCGLNITDIPQAPTCYHIFNSEDPASMHKKRGHKVVCRHPRRASDFYPSVQHKLFRHGCFKRYVDVGELYDERGCRTYPPMRGISFASNRLAKLEYLLKNKKEGCITSPQASLTPFSRAISLFVRYHACVCQGRYCNGSFSIKINILLLIITNTFLNL